MFGEGEYKRMYKEYQSITKGTKCVLLQLRVSSLNGLRCLDYQSQKIKVHVTKSSTPTEQNWSGTPEHHSFVSPLKRFEEKVWSFSISTKNLSSILILNYSPLKHRFWIMYFIFIGRKKGDLNTLRETPRPYRTTVCTPEAAVGRT